MLEGHNKCAPGKGGIPSLLTIERPRPALPEHERWTNDMIAHPRTKALVLLAALSLAAGCANPVFEEPRQSVGQTVAPGTQAEPQAVRLSVRDTVVVSL